MELKTMKILVVCAALLTASAVNVHAQKLSASTNLFGWAFLGTANVEAQYAVAQTWSVAVSGDYNPWTWKAHTADQFQWRRRSVALGARWWPWHVYSGWWVSGDLRWQEYNEARVLTKDITAEEGDRFGFRLGAGYTVMINSWLNVDFGIRGWGGLRDYTVYACPECGRIVEKGKGVFLLPDEAVVSLMFVF